MATVTASIPQSSLQVAQIIADLQTLQNADPTAASNLLAANKSISPTSIRRKSAAANPPEPPKFDHLGRRIVVPSPSAAGPGNTLSRIDSMGGSGYLAGSGRTSGTSSGANTPLPWNGASEQEMDEDLRRAKTLLGLFEMRGKFKQMGDIGLIRSKERVDKVAARYAEMEARERETTVRAKQLGL